MSNILTSHKHVPQRPLNMCAEDFPSASLSCRSYSELLTRRKTGCYLSPVAIRCTCCPAVIRLRMMSESHSFKMMTSLCLMYFPLNVSFHSLAAFLLPPCHSSFIFLYVQPTDCPSILLHDPGYSPKRLRLPSPGCTPAHRQRRYPEGFRLHRILTRLLFIHRGDSLIA